MEQQRLAMTRQRPIKHWLLLLVIVVLWGSAFGLTEVAITSFTPMALVTGRLILAAIVLTLIVWLRGQRLPRSARFWLFSLALAIAGNCLPFWLITRAQLTIDSGLAGILMSVMPLSTLLLAHLFVAGEQLNRYKLAGCFIGLAGLIVLIGPEAILELNGQGTALLAELATLFAAFCYAANAIIARHRPTFDPITAAAGTMIVGAAMMVPLGAAALPLQITNASGQALAAAIALAMMASALAPVVFYQLITLAGPSFVAFLNYLIPVWAVVIGVVLFGEQPRWTSLLALVIILIGLATSERDWRRSTVIDSQSS